MRLVTPGVSCYVMWFVCHFVHDWLILTTTTTFLISGHISAPYIVFCETGHFNSHPHSIPFHWSPLYIPGESHSLHIQYNTMVFQPMSKSNVIRFKSLGWKLKVKRDCAYTKFGEFIK